MDTETETETEKVGREREACWWESGAGRTCGANRVVLGVDAVGGAELAGDLKLVRVDVHGKDALRPRLLAPAAVELCKLPWTKQRALRSSGQEVQRIDMISFT
jgi:hypothetical protein